MPTVDQTAPISSKAIWAGRLMSGLVILFLLLDGGMKLIPLDVVIKASEPLGLPGELARTLGVLTLVCTLLYAFRRTAILGAILLTGYLGGAIATHLRVGVRSSAMSCSGPTSVSWSGAASICATAGCARSFRCCETDRSVP